MSDSEYLSGFCYLVPVRLLSALVGTSWLAIFCLLGAQPTLTTSERDRFSGNTCVARRLALLRSERPGFFQSFARPRSPGRPAPKWFSLWQALLGTGKQCLVVAARGVLTQLAGPFD